MTTVTIVIEVADEHADPDHDTGLTNDAYDYLMDALTSSVATGIVDIRKGGE